MKSSLLIPCFFFFALLCSGQEDHAKFKEIGLNATPFVNQYLDLGSGNGEFSSPYMITYEQRFGLMGSRIGVGIVSSNEVDNPVNDEPTDPRFYNSSLALDFRWGAVFYHDLSKRWSLKYGVDAIMNYDKTKNWTVTTNTFGEEVTATASVLSWETGVSPFLFVQFHLNDHFSFGTEILGKAAYMQTVAKNENTEFTDFNTRQESTAMRFNISPPTALFFILRI